MSEIDNRYLTVFGYDLTGAIIERIEFDDRQLDLYLSTHRMGIPDGTPRNRTDGLYLLSFKKIQTLKCDFSLTGELAERLENEGNEIHAYGFADNEISEDMSPGTLAVYFDTDWGLLEIAAAAITYSL